MRCHRNYHVPSGRRVSTRLGTATVELAICLPVLVTLVFGAIEASNAIYLKQALTEAAYETARTATATGGTQASAIARFQQIAAARGLVDATISITPTVTSATPPGTSVTVTVEAPASTNSYAPAFFMRTSRMRGQILMVRL